MKRHSLDTAIALILFNRPETTEKVFETIRAARPMKLLVVADGPRPDRPGEVDRCEAARAIIDRVDWPCDSWRRVWKQYDVDIAIWPEIRDGGWLCDWLEDRAAAERWTRIFDSVHPGEIDTWDYQLLLCNWAQGALSIIPSLNLVSNIGFHAGATHTTATSPFADMKREAIPFPSPIPPIVSATPGRMPIRRRASTRTKLAAGRQSGGSSAGP